MPALKVFMSNLGYARGIDGSLGHHFRYAHRHIYCSPAVQGKVLAQASELITRHDPDICCFVEVDQGNRRIPQSNQLLHLLGEKYVFYDIENKYGEASLLRNLWLTKGKSNAFLSKQKIPYKKHYFRMGTKRLLYELQPDTSFSIFFAHFSLNRNMRKAQLEELKERITALNQKVLVLGDFNILDGMEELAPLTQDGCLQLLNCENSPTFQFHKRKLVLDLALCTPGLCRDIDLQVIPQPYSDHAALMVTMEH